MRRSNEADAFKNIPKALKSLKYLSSIHFDNGELTVYFRSKERAGGQKVADYELAYSLYPEKKMARKYKQKYTINASGLSEAMWAFTFKLTSPRRDIAKVKRVHTEHAKIIKKIQSYKDALDKS